MAAAEPLYVVAKDTARNRVVVGPRAELATSSVRLEEVALHRPVDRVRAARLRYRASPIACDAVAAESGVELNLARPAEVASPGQV